MREARFRKPLTIALHPEVFDRIKKITDDEKRSLADFVRAAIDKALKEAGTRREGNGHEHRV